MKKIDKDYVEAKMALADLTEKDFASWLESRGWNDIKITEGKNSDYDVSAKKDGFQMTWEIKTAAQSEKYGSYFIEYYQSGLPSGMQLSVADYWVFYDERGEVRFIDREKLIEYIEERNLPLRPTGYVSYGKKVSAHGYVVPLEAFDFVMNHKIEIV